MTVMETDQNVSSDLKLWLLGLLPEQQSQFLEQRLITDELFYEELFIVEDELIDDYLAGKLTDNQRTAFESYFMNSAERQEQFRIANALKTYIGGDTKLDPSIQTRPDTSHNKPGAAVFHWMFSSKPIPTISLVAASLFICALVWLVFSSLQRG